MRIAARSLVRGSPGFSAVAVLTLALGVAATTTVYSLVDGVLIRPLPYPDDHELVQLWEVHERGVRNAVSAPTFLDWRAGTRSFRHLVARSNPAFGGAVTVLGGVEPVRVEVSRVTEGFFEMMGVAPVEGRAFQPADYESDATPVAVVDHGFWLEQLGGEPVRSGRTIEIAATRYVVVGVMPSRFAYPPDTRIWVPMVLEPGGSRSSHNWLVNGRLREGVTVEEARAETAALTGLLSRRFAGDMDARSAAVVPLRDALYGDFARPLGLLLGASGFVLLVACTNLASTLLARGRNRAGELAVRSALGASRTRVVGLLVTESGLLALGGAAAGALLAVPLLDAVLGAGPPLLRDRTALDVRVLAVSLTACIVTVVVFGLAPALSAARSDLAPTLRQGGRGTGGRKRGGWNALVAAEAALALVLLAGSTVLVRSFTRVMAVDPGFERRGVLTAELSFPSGSYSDDAALRRAHTDILRTVRAIPGVRSAGLVNHLPLGGIGFSGGFDDERGEMVGTLDYRVASSGYFRAMGIPVLEGRAFVPEDAPAEGDVAVVTRSAADRYWPDRNPVGERMRNLRNDSWIYGTDRWVTIVGVVGDVRHRDLTRPPRPTVYVYGAERPARASAPVLVLRTAGDPASLAGPVRDAIRRVDPELAVGLRPLEQRVAASVTDRRFTLLVLAGFAVTALLLAALGIYGVVSYAVARRTREMGIRLALGADPGSVLRLVVAGSLRTVLLGMGVGVVGALALGRVLSGLVFEVRPTDPLSLTFAAGVLLLVGALASLIPARRATRVDPVRTMRVE